MQKETKEIIKLTTKEVLKTIFDIPVKYSIAFEKKSVWRKIDDYQEYCRERFIDRENFKQKVRYLKRMGLIKIFVKDKEMHAELTSKGATKLQKIQYEDLKVAKPKMWDGFFRVLIFDIPEKHRAVRDMIREKINKIGFVQIQKSVFAHPFECKEIVDIINSKFGTEGQLKYMVVNIIEGEEEIINHFIENKMLTKDDLNKQSSIV